MKISRRWLGVSGLGAAAAIAMRSSSVWAIRSEPPTLETAGDGAVLRGGEPTSASDVILPGDGARIAAVLPLANVQIAAVAFMATMDMGSRGEMIAFVGSDGHETRILGVEPSSWHSPGGATLATRLSATNDGTRLRLERVAVRPRPGLPPRREAWIDYLTWREGAPLEDTPIHSPVPGTCQSAVAITRTRVEAALTNPCRQIDPAWLQGAGLLAAPF